MTEAKESKDKNSFNEININKKEKETSSSDTSENSQEENSDVELEKPSVTKPGDEQSVFIDRTIYLQTLKDLSYERHQLRMKNHILHRRLSEYYKKRKLDHVLKPMEGADLEEKYQQMLLSYEKLKENQEREIADLKSKLNAVQQHYNNQLEHAEEKFEVLLNHERNTGTGLIYSKKGKPISDKTVERLLTLQKRKSEQTSKLRLRFIRARNAVNDLENTVKKLEMIAPGLYVGKFEQLYDDHQNYKNKMEEREDELIKNRNKCTEHNQILAHIKEKMHHTDKIIDFAECDYGDAELDLLKSREDLGQVKTHRDKLRWALEEERLKAGLLTRKDLLRDFQDSIDEVNLIREKKISLENQIAKTTKQLREARRSINLQNKLDNQKEVDDNNDEFDF